MAITRTPMVDDDGTGTTGTVLNNAWKQQFYDQIDAMGTWQVVPYTAADYTAGGGGTWTGESADVLNFRYTLLTAKTMMVSLQLSGTDIAGVVSVLSIKIPGGMTVPVNMGTAIRLIEGTTRSFGSLYVSGNLIS